MSNLVDLQKEKKPNQENKCKFNPTNDCIECEFEGCPNWGASLEEGDLEQ